MYLMFIPILVFVAVVMVGAAALTGRAARQRRLRQRLREAQSPASPVPRKRDGQWLRRGLDRIGKLVSSRGPSSSLQEELAKAGYHGHEAASLYLGAKVVLFAAGLIGMTLLVLPLSAASMQKVLWVIGGATPLSFIPNLLVRLRRNRRQAEVRCHLPDSLDLLEICVSSGMGLDMAWNAVTDEIRGVSELVADEMTLTNTEMHLGASRADALRHMAERTGASELSSFVAVLVQSERFGTSISDAVKAFARSMREERSQRAEETAEKLAIKLLFPLVFFIFPALFGVMVGPAGIQLYEYFGGLS